MTDQEHNLAISHKGKFTELIVNLTINGGLGGQGVVWGAIACFICNLSTAGKEINETDKHHLKTQIIMTT